MNATNRPSSVAVGLSTVLLVGVLGPAVTAPLLARLTGYSAQPGNPSRIQTYEITDRSHAEGDVDYPQTPPVGGRHAEVWLDCGVYDEPVRDENAVHDLEHGTVWITYDPDLPARDVDVLASLLPDNGIMSPYDGLPSPVVVTVWGVQLRLDRAHDPRLPLFIEEYDDGHTAPEPGASCRGGVTDPTDEPPAPGLGV